MATVMYQPAPAASQYGAEMSSSDPMLQARHLRDMAERYLRMASDADPVTHDSLVLYASELLDRAQEIETVGIEEPETEESVAG
jgi:hypothetical protein